MNRRAALIVLGTVSTCAFVLSCANRTPSPDTPGEGRGEGRSAPTTTPTTRPTSQPTTRPSTRPTTGPTEQSADGVVAPPAPPYSPEESMGMIHLAPGFRIELVAAEPLVQDPVVMNFDADGRLWVAEMTSYMPDSYGHGEKEPTGKIVILEDTDGDGKMDKRSVWLEGLVLPRAVLPLRDGALVATPPYLKFYRDTDGDGRPDREQLVASDYGNPKQNPEHQANGLLLALDNWIYSANHDARFRWVRDDEAAAKGDRKAVKWLTARMPTRGQWGHSMDDVGRLYHNSNSDYLRADLVPAYYFPSRNPHYAGQAGINFQLDKDQTVWPIRPTPAVNRGYRQGFLREDGSLKEFTAACAPCVYRGGIFPPDCDGDVFVCEPSAHVVRRANITEDGVTLRAKNAYDKAEFLASTDERFRPVNLNVGPDGALYVVDLYRGILQHTFYLTGYLRELHLRRNMELPVHLGRIYRVTHELTPPRKFENLSGLPAAQLVEKLKDPNGWIRDTAQRLLVERNDRTVFGSLRGILRSIPPSPSTPGEASGIGDRPRAGRGEGPSATALHALWTLDGLNALDRPTLLQSLDVGPPAIVAAAVRLSERHLAGQAPGRPPTELLARILHVAETSTDPHVRVQCAFTLSAVEHPSATRAVAALLADAPEDKILRDAAMSGLAGHESDTLDLLLANDTFAAKAPGSEATLAALAGAMLKEGKPDHVERLLTTCADDERAPAWQQLAILSGMADVAKKYKDAAAGSGATFAAAPQPFLSLAESTNGRISDLATAIAPLLHWPGKVDLKQKPATPLTAAQQKLFDEGKVVFNATCAACHQAGGEGLEGKAPPLRGSPWVAGSASRLVRIVLNGVRGPIHVADDLINMEMPNLAVLDDRSVAAVLTYARREWGHTADPVDPETVAKVRAQVKGRPDAWTEEELLKVK